MTKKEWIMNRKWVKCQNGTYVNRDYIQFIGLLHREESEYAILAILASGDKVTLISKFANQEEAQNHLDKMEMLYDLHDVVELPEVTDEPVGQ